MSRFLAVSVRVKVEILDDTRSTTLSLGLSPVRRAGFLLKNSLISLYFVLISGYVYFSVSRLDFASALSSSLVFVGMRDFTGPDSITVFSELLLGG